MDSFSRDGLRFDVLDEGPEGADVVVLLHGFPQSAHTWAEVSPLLVSAGYRVVAPDQRGYAPHGRPRSRRAYRLKELVADVVALIDAIGADRVHLVGHDWGGGVAWLVATERPDRLHSLTVVSAPHPGAVTKAMWTSWQLLRSWYLIFFLVPWFPEMAIRLRHGRPAIAWLRRTGLRDEQARAYVDRLNNDAGALAGSLRWYRALPLDIAAGLRTAAVAVPTTYIWSTGDVAIGRRAAELTRRWVTAPYEFEVLDGVSHWIPEEVPHRLAASILRQIAATSPPGT
jgi:pimeloyl-ACP methyl ester carboxylesterase